MSAGDVLYIIAECDKDGDQCLSHDEMVAGHRAATLCNPGCSPKYQAATLRNPGCGPT